MFSMFGKRDTSCRCEADSEGETNSWLGVLSLTWERHRCDVMKGRQPELGVLATRFFYGPKLFSGDFFDRGGDALLSENTGGETFCVLYGASE